MQHSLNLINTLAAGLGLALVFGFVAVRLKLPALVGYLLAGLAIGPFTPGFKADVDIAGQLAEIGVMLLMFGVGLHFSIKDLLSVRRIALPGALAQILVATGLGMGLAAFWGWDVGAAVVFGLALSVASTVVLLRALESLGLLESVNGRIAVGWLVVEDLVMVLVLVLLPPLAALNGNGAGADLAGTARSLLPLLAATLGKVVLFVASMLVVGGRLFPWMLWQVARTGSRELFTLSVIAAAVGIAFVAALLFGVSFAIGAFFAGVVLRKSALSFRAAEESLPLREAFSVLFFVSVGMLLDPRVLLDQPLQLLAVLSIVLFGKSAVAFFIVLGFRYPLNTAITVSASLAQIGEFSFILAGLGLTLGILPAEGHSLILAAAIVSIAANPLIFKTIEPLQAWIRRHSRLARLLERSADPLAQLPVTVEPKHVTGHVVLVGYGGVGERLARILDGKGVPYVVAEQNRETVEKLRALGVKAVAGEASDPGVLIQAHVARASVLAIAVPDALQVRKMIETARLLNPKIEVAARAYGEEAAELLRKEHPGNYFLGEQELAANMGRFVVEKTAE